MSAFEKAVALFEQFKRAFETDPTRAQEILPKLKVLLTSFSSSLLPIEGGNQDEIQKELLLTSTSSIQSHIFCFFFV